MKQKNETSVKESLNLFFQYNAHQYISLNQLIMNEGFLELIFTIYYDFLLEKLYPFLLPIKYIESHSCLNFQHSLKTAAELLHL